MMRVKVKIKGVLHDTPKATLFLISEKEVWLPKKLYSFGRGNFIIVGKNVADEKGLRYTPFLHTPDEITPEYNQKPLEELCDD